MDPAQAAKNALKYVFDAKKGDSLVIFCDDTKTQIGKAFEKGAKQLQLDVKLVVLKTSANTSRKEIPTQAEKYLTTQRPQIYINLLEGNREETPFRIKLIQTETSDHKTRLGHGPGVTMDMLTEGALALTGEEHEQMQNFAYELMQKLQNAEKIQIVTPAGTNVSLSVKGRPFYTDTKLDWRLMKWMNLPTGEVIAAPAEDSLEGTLVCDLAIGGIGPLKKPLTIFAEKGRVKNATSLDNDTLKRVQDSLETDDMSDVVGEFAFGINPKARFVKEFLESEKILGTIHIAFGDNLDMPGGKNNSANHMDFMMDKPTVTTISSKGSKQQLLKDGVFCSD